MSVVCLIQIHIIKSDDQKDGSTLTQSFQNLFVKAYKFTVKL